MLASYGHVEFENHVLGPSTGVASQIRLPATGPLDFKHGPNGEVDVDHLGKGKGAATENDDGIGPDDAPELGYKNLNWV